MMVESGVGEAGHVKTMLVDQGAHPELLFGGEDEEQDKGSHYLTIQHCTVPSQQRNAG